MALLTIFTPAYNRAHTLERTYRSLANQTCRDFEWLIVDDGSKDNTRALVQSWIDTTSLNENRITGYSKAAPWLKIRYIYQQNQGMHGAHNTAYENISTELNTCIDSDDYMPANAVEIISSFWHALSDADKNRYAGIIGLDIDDKNKRVIGGVFPENVKSTTLMGYYANGGQGDKKIVYRTDIINSTPPYPIFERERYVGLAYKYMLIDQEYELLTINEPLAVVEYQPDGSSNNMFSQYWRNPKGFAFFRKTEMMCSPSLKRKFVSCIHYVSSSIIAKNTRFIFESPQKLMTLMAVPVGVLLYFWIRTKVRHTK